MSASCEWSLFLEGRNRNKYLKDILDILYQIEGVEEQEGKNIYSIFDGKHFITKKPYTSISTDNGKARRIWGENYLEPEIKPFLLLAKGIPQANWTIKTTCISESGGEGCESYSEAVYSDGHLEVRIQTYIDTVALPMLIERMTGSENSEVSYDEFCAFYHVDDTIDEDTFEDSKTEWDDEFYYDHNDKSVSRNHHWMISVYSIESDGTIKNSAGNSITV